MNRAQTDRNPSRDGNGTGVALPSGLAWFGIGLGLAEGLAPASVARLIGVPPTDRNVGVLRAMGVREIASGVGILANPRSPGRVWSRVAGDVMDLVLLQRAYAEPRTSRDRTVAAALAVLGVAALDVIAGDRASRRERPDVQSVRRVRKEDGGIQVSKTVSIAKPRAEVYAFWHDFENLPRFMTHLESVQVTGEGRSHWKAKAPAGASVEWDAEITEDRLDERIAWRSLPGAAVSNRGSVDFRDAPGDRGTEVTVKLQYDPPGGFITNALATLFREAPGQQVQDDLRAFKQMLETGEVLISEATIRRGPHAAQPEERSS